MIFSAVVVLLAQAPLPPDHPAEMPPNHPAMPAADAPAPSARDLLQKLDGMRDLADKDKPFEVAASLGRLYYAHGRFADASTFLSQAVEKAKSAREFYLAQKKAAGSKPMPAASTIGCASKPEDKLEEQLALAKTKAKADPAAAAACIRAALHPLIEVETQLGNSRFLLHDPAGALASFESALVLFESNPEARYGRGAVLLDSRGDDPKALADAKAEFERFVKDYPTSPRAKQAKALLERTDAAIAAGGVSKLGPIAYVAPAADPHAAQNGTGMPVLTKDMIDAVQNVERTPELEQGFDKLIEQGEDALAHGKYQDALDAYKRVVPFNPDNARAKAGMAWSLVRLEKPMAANVWNVASANPEAIDALGDRLKQKGDGEGAKLLWAKLRESVPSYASKVEPKLK